MASKNKNFADDGWAIWIDGEDTSTVYITEWINPRKKSFVDLAVRIKGVRSTKMLNIYVPFNIEEDEIEDVSLFLEDEGILRATFSAACIIDYMKNSCTSEVAYNGKTIDLVHISKFGLSIRPLSSGTLFSVNLEALREHLDNDECYILFRIPHKSIDSIFKPKINVASTLVRIRDLITSPVVSERYGYSIRINESRHIPAEINRIGAFHRQKLKKAIVTISVDESYEINDSNCYRIRRLEEDLYENYAPDGYDCGDAITYQWKQTRNENLRAHFNFYFNIAKDSVSQMSMLIYMILLLLVGIAGGALWDLMKFLLSL